MSVNPFEQEHPVQQPIKYIVVWQNPENTASEIYQTDFGGVTRIEACVKPGMHANLPYLRVWMGDRAHAEFCQHQILGVYFE